MLKAILFDFDGTITESNDIKTDAFRELFKNEDKYDLKDILDYHIEHGGINREVKIIHFYKNILNRELTNEKLQEILDMFAEIVKEKMIEVPYVKGIFEAIKNNYKKYTFFIVSGMPQNELEEIVERRGLRQYFRKIYGYPPEKATIIKTILNENNFLKNDIIFIGDSMDDLKAAESEGVEFKEAIRCPELGGCKITRSAIKTKLEWDLLYEDLKIFKEGCKKYNIHWCLYTGSILGAVRDKDFIQPGAHALCVALLPPTTRESYFEAMEYFKTKGFRLDLIKMNPSYLHKRESEGIEMYHMGIKNDYYYCKHLPFHRKFFDNLKTAKIRDEECPIPNFAEELLETLYGSNWKMPLKNHHCNFSREYGILLERQKKGI